jgi:TrmH family RNA methyltransferase
MSSRLQRFSLLRYNRTMRSTDPLRNISIVLVRTKTPGNIGAVARAMMNMGLSRLILVRPPQDDTGEALRLASGAERIIEEAERVATLPEALAGQELVIGTTRHHGKLRKNISTPRELAQRVLPLLPRNRVAILFGREVNGLDRKELALCNELVSIPASEELASLNLSHAVMIVAYELFLATRIRYPAEERALAPAADLERFFVHLQRTLEQIEFLDRERPDRIMASLRSLFSRSRPDARDVQMLRGILTAVNRQKGHTSTD